MLIPGKFEILSAKPRLECKRTIFLKIIRLFLEKHTTIGGPDLTYIIYISLKICERDYLHVKKRHENKIPSVS